MIFGWLGFWLRSFGILDDWFGRVTRDAESTPPPTSPELLIGSYITRSSHEPPLPPPPPTLSYVPVVVAKCGLYLKDTATEVPGTFRVSGSAKRMKELQAVFDNGPKVGRWSCLVRDLGELTDAFGGHAQYGKNLDWKKTSYTTHDVATILRRYLTQMPEPIVPHELYHDVSWSGFWRLCMGRRADVRSPTLVVPKQLA